MSFTKWFTADTHFGSERTLKLSRRPFLSTEEMDLEIIRNWNITVKDDDIVYHLGDFGNINIRPYLNGKINLVMGNYDIIEYNKNTLMKEYFNEIFVNEPIIEVNDVKLRLVHEPIEILQSNNCFYLFGHVHQLSMVKRNGLNVGVDCHNFKPIDIETVFFYRNAILNHYDENVFME